jgi:hypothetical protein
MVRRIAIPCLVSMAVAGLGGAAMAAAPSNDDRGSATVVGAVPFDDSVDTSDATEQANDPDCIPTSKTVWYSFTPDTTRRYAATTVGSSFDTTLTVGHVTGGGLDIVDCNDDFSGLTSAISWEATAGEEYLIMAGELGGGGAGGSLEFQIRQAPARPTIAVTVNDRATLTPLGGAIIRGRLRCTRASEAELTVIGRQDAGRIIVRGIGERQVACDSRWRIRIADEDFRFARGKLRITARAQACNSSSCAGTTVRKRVALR